MSLLTSAATTVQGKVHPGRMLLFLALLRLAALTHAQTSPPAMTVQPRNPSVSLGANVTFRATATGTPPLMYQWRFNDVALEGATNSTLDLSHISVSLGGGYVVVVTTWTAPQPAASPLWRLIPRSPRSRPD